MEKEHKFKLLKFPSFFTSSCKTQNISEVIDHNQNPIISQSSLIEKIQDNVVENEDNLVFKPKQIHYSPINNISSSSSTSLMMCKPRCPQTYDHNIRENRVSRRKVAGKWSLLSPYGDFSGRKCPPTSPASPLLHKQGKKKNLNKNKKKEKSMKKGFKQNPFSLSSSNETDDNGDWFSSDDEREYYEKQTMLSLKSFSFSSKSISFSSDSDTPDNKTRTRTQAQAREKPRVQRRKPSSRVVKEVGVVPFDGKVKDSLGSLSFSPKSIFFSCESDNPDNQTQARTQTLTQARDRPRVRRRKPSSKIKEVGVVPLEGKVKDTFAIVKSSSDPYNDFRASMVEMIIEKQIFRAKELKHLLECFISLNSCHHHRVILEVFTEICDALFSYC